MVCGDWFCTDCVGSQSGADNSSGFSASASTASARGLLCRAHDRSLSESARSWACTTRASRQRCTLGASPPSTPRPASACTTGRSGQSRRRARRTFTWRTRRASRTAWREPRQYWRLIKPLFDVRLGEQMVGTPPTARRSLTLSRQVEQGRVSGYLQAFHL